MASEHDDARLMRDLEAAAFIAPAPVRSGVTYTDAEKEADAQLLQTLESAGFISTDQANDGRDNRKSTSSSHLYRNFGRLAAGVVLVYAFISYVNAWGSPAHGSQHGEGWEPSVAKLADMCPQAEAIVPEANSEIHETMAGLIKTDEFRNKSIEWLSGAVQVPTPSFDKMGPVGEDERWEVFGPFHDYLASAFPLVHKKLALTKVNTYGLLYVWQGSASAAELKPLLLMGHQDVVPVEPTTVDQWAHPPFSGFYDGENIWGRGSSDDKSGLIGIMSTIETLLSQDFTPTRTVFLSFGFDEESDQKGAQALASHITEKYGEDLFAMIVDEGGGFGEKFGTTFAVPAIAEKGYLDTRIEINSPGGHSSVPPPHTSIGMLSSMLVHFEENPYTPVLARDTPPYLTARCLGAFGKDVPTKLRRALAASDKCDAALKMAGEELIKDLQFKSLVGTTQAIDLVQGGVKTNALPEQAWAVVNHRIASDSSVGAVQKHDAALLASLASTYNLSYTAFGSKVSSDSDSDSSYGTLALTDAWGTALEPAPVTPTRGDEAKPYELLSGTIKATYAAHRAGTDADAEIAIAPSMSTGNTDTRYYWKLSSHIFRYNHHNGKGRAALSGVHTVNESISVDAFLEMIRFFSTLILNVDEANL